MSLTTDSAIFPFTQADPFYMAPGDWWLYNPTGVEQVEVAFALDQTWEAAPVVATQNLFTFPGGLHVRPATAGVTMYARRARFV